MSETRAPSPSREQAPTAGFVRALGLFDATMLVAGSMIGSGIFIVSSEIARSMGSPAGLLLVWGLTGLMTCLGALAYGELATILPRAGGQYVYLREAYGPAAGFLYGWTFLLVIQTGTIAAVAVAFGKFLGVFFPALGETRTLIETGLPKAWPFATINSAQFAAAALIALLTAVNLRGIAVGKWIQNVFTSAKVVALLGVIAVGVWAAAALPTAQGFGAVFRTNAGGGILGGASVSAPWSEPSSRAMPGTTSPSCRRRCATHDGRFPSRSSWERAS
jgi:APA family basic amino acid/polyamine antiporter